MYGPVLERPRRDASTAVAKRVFSQVCVWRFDFLPGAVSSKPSFVLEKYWRVCQVEAFQRSVYAIVPVSDVIMLKVLALPRCWNDCYTTYGCAPV